MVIKRVIGAALRAILMAVLVAVPSIVLADTTSDGAHIVALVAMVAAVVTFAEYYSEYPTFIEFRDAPPFNRLRFLALFLTALLASLLMAAPAGQQGLIMRMAEALGGALDVPFSPIRLMLIAFADHQTFYDPSLVRQLAGLSMGVMLIALGLFAIHARFIFWPIRKAPFNFWINLPLFDPTTGGDVLMRLRRDAHVNLALGFLLPFLIPALLRFWFVTVDPTLIGVPQAMIWIMCGWSFLPLTLMMRGLALFRVAALIEEKRRRAYAQSEDFQIA